MKIRKLILLLSILSSVTFLAFSFKNAADAPIWDIDNSHSSVSFTTSHFFIPVEGAFDRFSGSLKFDPNNLEGSSAEFKIEITSVNTKDSKRDGHLQSKDFFDAKTYPTMSFKSTKISKISEKEFMMDGQMTIKGKTKIISVPFTLLNIMDHPMKKGSLVAGLKGKTTIKRSDFGIGTGDWSADKVVADETEVRIILEVSRKK